MSFIGELKRRNVIRVAGVYIVVGWILVQVAATLEEAISLPPWFDAVTVSFLAIGFPLALIFAWAFELTPEGIKRTESVQPGESITQQTASKLDMVLIVALLLFTAAIALPRFLPSQDGAPVETTAKQDQPASEAQPESDPNEASIAVLPFADLSAAGDQEYFADGISEELLNVLAQVGGLKVAGRTSSFAFKGRNEDLREIGRVLDVAHILEGSVRSDGNQVRVTAQLIQVSDGFHLWSQTYDRELKSIFAVQDDIAQQILVAMKERLGVEKAQSLAPSARTDIDAYTLFLEARDLVFSRDVESMTRAVELLDRAIAIDAEYAPAYAARAKAVTLLSDRPGSYGVIPAQQALGRAQQDVARALELDPNLADAHAVQGLINADIGKPDFAVSSLRRALEINPNSLDARNWLAIALTTDGRLRDVLDELRKLVKIDPLYEPGVNNAMTYSLEVGDDAYAKEIVERFKASGVDPVKTTFMEATLADARGDIAKAINILNSVPRDSWDRRFEESASLRYFDLGIDAAQRSLADVPADLKPFVPLFQRDQEGAVNLAKQTVEAFPEYYVAHRTYVRILSRTRRDAEVADYFETEYASDMSAYETRLRPSASAQFPPYMELALAMRAIGNDEDYQSAMQRWRFAIDIFRAGGSVAPRWFVDDARYRAIEGDVDASLKALEQGFERANLLNVMTFAERAFDGVKDEPRFIAVRDENTRRVNEQRAQLGYEPLPADFYDGR
ncbi:MAG: hypothetical protein Cons2KO_14310 [Congregibacter sp.]